MAITPEQIAGVLTAGGYDVASFGATMGRLAALDALNKLRSRRALLVAEHAAVRSAQEAELAALDAEVAAAQAAADEVVGA